MYYSLLITTDSQKNHWSNVCRWNVLHIIIIVAVVVVLVIGFILEKVITAKIALTQMQGNIFLSPANNAAFHLSVDKADTTLPTHRSPVLPLKS